MRDGAEAGESEQSEAAVFMQMLCDGGTSNIFEPTASQDSSVSINTLHVIGNRGAKKDEKTGIRRMKRRLNTPQKNRVTDLGGGWRIKCRMSHSQLDDVQRLKWWRVQGGQNRGRLVERKLWRWLRGCQKILLVWFLVTLHRCEVCGSPPTCAASYTGDSKYKPNTRNDTPFPQTKE